MHIVNRKDWLQCLAYIERITEMHIVNRKDWLQCLAYIERITGAYSQ